MTWKIVRSTFVYPEGIATMPSMVERVRNDVNNDKIKINGINAKQVGITDDFFTFLAIWYGYEKEEQKECGAMLVQMLSDNLPNIWLIEADGYKYLRVDVRQQTIEMKRPD